MKREIKFRAWNPDRKEMFIGGELKFWFRAISETGKNPFDINPNEIYMQFTGLHDKNGKEIYEGDIVAVESMRKTKTGEKMFSRPPRVIEWVHTKSNTGFNIAGSPDDYGNVELRTVEIIGNIYENPELLTTPSSQGN